MHTRLIMLEGVPFTGKSTLSELVAQQLELNGTPVFWAPEGLMLQQFFPSMLTVFDQPASLSEEALWANWRDFVQAVARADTTFVVDAALSYAGVHPLVAADRPADAILAYARRIADLCAPLHPCVIHLIGDADRIARASIAERGAGWHDQLVDQAAASPYQQARGRSGLAGAIAMLHEEQALTQQVLADVRWPTLTLDVTNAERDANQRAILQFLGIPEVVVERPVLLPGELGRYTGTYAAEAAEDAAETLIVQLEQETLALHAPRMRYGALVPVSAHRFHLTATQYDAEFVMEDDAARRLVLVRVDGMRQGFRRV